MVIVIRQSTRKKVPRPYWNHLITMRTCIPRTLSNLPSALMIFKWERKWKVKCRYLNRWYGNWNLTECSELQSRRPLRFFKQPSSPIVRPFPFPTLKNCSVWREVNCPIPLGIWSSLSNVKKLRCLKLIKFLIPLGSSIPILWSPDSRIISVRKL